MDRNIGCVLAVVSKEALPLWTLPPRRREPREQGLRAFGPELLPPGIAWGDPAASRGRVFALCAADRTNPLTRHPLDSAVIDVVWLEEALRAGPEAAARSEAQGTGEDSEALKEPDYKPQSTPLKNSPNRVEVYYSLFDVGIDGMLKMARQCRGLYC